MTIDEILERHGLAMADIVHFYPHGEYKGEPVVCDCKRCEGDYALVRDAIREDEWQYVLYSTGYQIVGYYPAARLYLVKRKASKKDTMTITATMDYRFGWNNYGFVGEYKNFKLECK